jgi:excinuclease UvrABC nuclease subunit
LGVDFGIYSMDGAWNDVPGVYIFAGAVSANGWGAAYVGQASGFKSRFGSHDQWEPARRLGATHVHACVVNDPALRSRLEADLIRALQPPLNTQLR